MRLHSLWDDVFKADYVPQFSIEILTGVNPFHVTVINPLRSAKQWLLLLWPWESDLHYIWQYPQHTHFSQHALITIISSVCLQFSCSFIVQEGVATNKQMLIDIFHPQYYGAIHNCPKHHFLMHNKASCVICFCLALSFWIYHWVSLVRNPSSEISLCAEGIFFQDSLFCILCVFSWDADLETQCTLWVPLCLFPAQTALLCCRLISFGLINRAPGHTQIWIFHSSTIFLCGVSKCFYVFAYS